MRRSSSPAPRGHTALPERGSRRDRNGIRPRFRGLVLSEERTRRDDRRAELEILVFNAGLLQLDVPEERFSRPTRPTRRRVVLFADGSSELRWWDPSGAGGPIEFDELPVSGERGASPVA